MKFVSNIFNFLLSTVISKSLLLLVIPLYTSRLSLDEYGLLSLVQSYMPIIAVVMTMQLQSSVIRYYFEYKHDEVVLKRYLGSVLIITLAISTAIALGVEFAGDRLTSTVFSTDLAYRPFFSIGTWTVWATALSAVPSGVLRAQERARTFMLLSITTAVSSLSMAYVMVVILNWGLYGALLAGLLGELFSGFFFLGATFRSYSMRIEWKILEGPIRYSLPIIPHALLGYVFMYSDRLILERYTTLGAIGIYSLADRFSMVVKIAVNSFNNAYSPYFIRVCEEKGVAGLPQLGDIMTLSIYILSGMALTLSLFAREIVALFAHPDYHQSWVLIPILATAYIFRLLYIFASGGIFYRRKTKWIPVITIIAATVNIGLNIWGVPRWGITFTAWSTLVSFAITYVVALILSFWIFPLRWNWGRDFIIMALYGVLVLGGYHLASMSGSSWLSLSVRTSMALLYGAVGVALFGRGFRHSLQSLLRVPTGRGITDETS